MRLLLGATAGSASVFAFIVIVAGCLLGFFGKPYYFGLFPTFMSKGDTEPVGWMAPLIRLWNAVTHPLRLRMENEQQDKAALIETMSTFLVSEEKSIHMKTELAEAAAGSLYTLSRGMIPKLPILQDAVCEPFFEAARIAGSQPASTWATTMEKLSVTKVGDFLIAQLGGEIPEAASS